MPKQVLNPSEQYAIEFALQQIDKIRYAPRGEAHNIAVRLSTALQAKLKGETSERN